jgi:hypothetical protein
MSTPTDNENWIVERGGEVVEKKARVGLASLDDWEHLVYCLWVADYMMRNAGDLANEEALYPAFRTKATASARKLGLRVTESAFALPASQLEHEYFDRFEAICNEIRMHSLPRS